MNGAEGSTIFTENGTGTHTRIQVEFGIEKLFKGFQYPRLIITKGMGRHGDGS